MALEAMQPQRQAEQALEQNLMETPQLGRLMAVVLVEMTVLMELALLAVKAQFASSGPVLAPSPAWQANNQE
jgi:hypothetical protein